VATERDASADACPYVGLQPYREEDRAYFFGRERDIESVIDNLYAARLTVYYGASGVGKSSVLMAGVVPALRCEPRWRHLREMETEGVVACRRIETLGAEGTDHALGDAVPAPQLPHPAGQAGCSPDPVDGDPRTGSSASVGSA